MKKPFSSLLVVLLILAMAVIPVSANRGLSFDAEYGKPTIDGKVDDIWANCKTSATVNLPHDGNNKGSSDTAAVKALWDEDGFYFLVTAKDSSFVDAECFEFYLDEVYDKGEAFNKFDRQSRITVKTGEIIASTKDADGNDTGRQHLFNKAAHSTTSDGWILEASFKWSGLTEIKAGMTVGAEFMWDDQGAGLALRWNVDTANGDKKPFQSTIDFGGMVLKAKPVAAATNAAAAKAAATADPAAVTVLALLAAVPAAALLAKKRK